MRPEHLDILEEIQSLYDKASELHMKSIVEQARRILELPGCKAWSFCMGMGTATFRAKTEHVDEENPIVRDFYNFLYEWNDVYHTTGYPYRIDRVKGVLVERTDW
jgi:hypothetical protein